MTDHHESHIPALDAPDCGLDGEKCQGKGTEGKSQFAETIGINSLGLLILVVLLFFACRLTKRRSGGDSLVWNVNHRRLSLQKPIEQSDQEESDLLGPERYSFMSGINANGGPYYLDDQKPVDLLPISPFDLRKDSQFKKRLSQLLSLKHSNLTLFYGVSVKHSKLQGIWEHCPNFSLMEIISAWNEKSFIIDDLVQYSLARDVCAGLKYLHSTDVKVHGDLKSSTCFVDEHWTCKLSGFGLRQFHEDRTYKSAQTNDEYIKARSLNLDSANSTPCRVQSVTHNEEQVPHREPFLASEKSEIHPETFIKELPEVSSDSAGSTAVQTKRTSKGTQVSPSTGTVQGSHNLEVYRGLSFTANRTFPKEPRRSNPRLPFATPSFYALCIAGTDSDPELQKDSVTTPITKPSLSLVASKMLIGSMEETMDFTVQNCAEFVTQVHQDGEGHSQCAISLALIGRSHLSVEGSAACEIMTIFKISSASTIKSSINELLRGRALALCPEYFWKAPEVLNEILKGNMVSLTQEADIYAAAIIMKELFTRETPFYHELLTFTPKEIIIRLATYSWVGPPFRPEITALSPAMQKVTPIIRSCWDELPSSRPTAKNLYRQLQRANDNKDVGSITSSLLKAMNTYSSKLEDLVAERTRELDEEKRRTEMLLYQMLPPAVADELKRGRKAQAEAFDSVTVYFSDIVGFTAIASSCKPIQIVQFLNALYTLFDNIVSCYNVYKVETVGDAYMVVSGLPLPNEVHAYAIADMSLALRDAASGFVLPHDPSTNIKIRTGLNSGPVVAGVVGKTMPRYCLFGDTVNVASRMESSGLPNEIHVSTTTYRLLVRNPMYILSARGRILVKGKGLMATYFLKGKTRASIVKQAW